MKNGGMLENYLQGSDNLPAPSQPGLFAERLKRGIRCRGTYTPSGSIRLTRLIEQGHYNEAVTTAARAIEMLLEELFSELMKNVSSA